jgi:hypothetical protein
MHLLRCESREADSDPRPVYGEQVEGRLVFDTPRLGVAVDLFRQPAGLALLVGLPIAAGVMAELLGRSRRRNAPGKTGSQRVDGSRLQLRSGRSIGKR